MFHWNTGVKQHVDEEYKIYTSKLDEKFVSILLTMFAAYAFAMLAMASECLFSYHRKKWVAIRIWSNFLDILLCFKNTVPRCLKKFTENIFAKIKTFYFVKLQKWLFGENCCRLGLYQKGRIISSLLTTVVMVNLLMILR